jgi:hypothetical protein
MSTAYRRNHLSDAEREQRRAADRERVKEAAEQLLTSDGWQRWVRARALFTRYSARNSMLLALEFHRRGIPPEPVAGFRTWLKLGRAVHKGETSMKVLAPVPTNKRSTEARGADTGERGDKQDDQPRIFFRTASVFSVSQTDPLAGVEQLPLTPPCEPLTGDTHAHLLQPLCELASELRYTVTFEPIPGMTGGWCDSNAKRIVVDTTSRPTGRSAHSYTNSSTRSV